MRRALRICTIKQLERSIQAAGFDAYVCPGLEAPDFNRPLRVRLNDGNTFRAFLQQHEIELIFDFNSALMTFVYNNSQQTQVEMTNSALGIPYVACYLDPVTSTMSGMPWEDHWRLLEAPGWIKWVWESAHAEELGKLGIPNVIVMPMAAADDDFDTSTPKVEVNGPAVAFMGHPASSWFQSSQTVLPAQLFAGLTAAAVHADMPDLPFHKIFYDLYGFANPPEASEDFAVRATKARQYFDQKFVYNAYLAIKQRDRFARFLKLKLGDAFELIGDHWQSTYGLKHTPRIWDMNQLHERMRTVPICINLMKGCLETGLNIRHFEITAYGGFMLTYATAGLESCFEIGAECDVFRDEAELLEKIGYYLENPRKRQEIATAGQKRTLRNHLYSHRITNLVESLRNAGLLTQPKISAPLFQPGAPKTIECKDVAKPTST